MNQQSANEFENEMPDHVLEQAMASIQGETIPLGPPPELVAATLRAIQNQLVLEAPLLVPHVHSHWRRFMSHPAPRLAAVVLVATSVYAVYLLLIGTHSTSAS